MTAATMDDEVGALEPLTVGADGDLQLDHMNPDLLTPAELIDHLAAMTDGGDSDLAAVLAHVCARLDQLGALADAVLPAVESMAAVGEAVAEGGIMGLMGALQAAG